MLLGAKTTTEIARWICTTDYRDFPSEVIAYTKLLALSHLGMTVAGSTLPNGRRVLDYVRANAGRPEAGVLGAGFRAAAEYAAMANGNSAHSTELEDDSYPEGNYSCGYWPAVLALAEKLKASGKDVIEAVVVGYDVAAKLGAIYCENAVPKGWANHAACATIASAASATKLLRLDPRQTAWALSLAASQATGLRLQTGTGAHLVEAGFAGRNGLAAAALAGLGVSGCESVFEARTGFGALWADRPDFDLALGDEFRIMRVGIKKYACCYLMQRNLDGVRDLVTEHGIVWDEVASIEHEINATARVPLRIDRPETGEESRFSLPHATVACFFDDKVFLESFTDATARDSRWAEARARVKVIIHPEWPIGNFAFDSPVTIKMKDGRVYRKICVSARGDPDKRLSSADVMTKYLDCMQFAGIFSSNRVEQAAEMTLAMENLPDVSVLANMLTCPDKP